MLGVPTSIASINLEWRKPHTSREDNKGKVINGLEIFTWKEMRMLRDLRIIWNGKQKEILSVKVRIPDINKSNLLSGQTIYWI